ncbi:MFS family permease [Arthrobacter stackebrandtii]|uniref:MFS family permease n=1 Tax=Arthrobacter stackebrandtii TaxID=272161 RepID=A0ABS4YVC5_9MICC|nr:MFS transporter [Arthrobacter stackebrandtii]MBP2412748.1 MFS family permease [Arthrobacter stackebrandtii]PYG99893.1 MFS transporter [Arthrobacter stackebrandtii]
MSSSTLRRRNQTVLVIGQLLSGVGVASGVAVGGILAAQLAGTTAASGFVQTASALGAGLVAVPLANLAVRAGRRWALSAGFALGAVGAATVLLAAALGQFWLMAAGMLFFGSATAAGLQARYAAVDGAPPEKAGRAMAIVIWATTVGSVAGPNLSEPGRQLGISLGLVPLSGPFVFSLVAFVTAALVISIFFLAPPAAAPAAQAAASPNDGAAEASGFGEDRGPALSAAGASTPAKPAKGHGAWRALRLASHNPRALAALATVTGGHAIMVGVMVMTPVAMDAHGHSLEIIGIVISLHILGMYAASPIFGWLVDRLGPLRVVLLGCAIFLAAIATGAVVSDSSNPVLMSVALTLLGLGWSACLIGGSSLLNQSAPDELRVPLQGANDMMMNFGAAGMAALAGPVLALGGFFWVNMMALAVLVVMVVLGVRAFLSTPEPSAAERLTDAVG